MPYISPSERDRLNNLVNEINHEEIKTAGNVNFLITKLCQKFLSEGSPNYDRYNAIIGILESAKLEWYRRKVAIYEDAKIIENGDV